MEGSQPNEQNVTFDEAAESWLREEAAAAFDALKADSARVIPAEDVRAEFEVQWRQRSAQHRAEAAAALRAAGDKLDGRLQLSEAELEAAIEDFERLRKSGE